MRETIETGPDGIPAATVVIFRNAPAGGPPEILMTIRSREMVFAGGMAVFPGGRVDPADFDLGARIGGPLDPDEAAHQVAVVRETLEETGLAIGLSGEIDADKARAARSFLQQTGELAPVLDHFGWDLDLQQLVPFARWFPRTSASRASTTRGSTLQISGRGRSKSKPICRRTPICSGPVHRMRSLRPNRAISS